MENYNGKGYRDRRVIAEVNSYSSRHNARMENRNVRTHGYAAPSSQKRKKKRGLSFAAALIIDAVAIAAFLLTFAYFHHVNPIFREIDEPMTLPAPEEFTEPTPEEQPSLLPAVPETDPEESTDPQPSDTPAEPQHKFEDKFSAEVVHTDNQYITENVNVTVSTTNENGVTYHTADIYVRDVKYLQAGFVTAEGFGYTKSHNALIQDAAKFANAFVAINGDQYGARKEGVIVRNGVLYRDELFEDVCVLKNDGTMVTYGESEFTTDAITDGAWQVWSFGPELLDENGNTMTEFNTTVGGPNPRSAIGMIEPLHYVLVTVDGRGESAGLSMTDLSALMKELGCTAAYNLDGGATAAMAVNGELYSTPSKTRSVFDIIYVAMED